MSWMSERYIPPAYLPRGSASAEPPRGGGIDQPPKLVEFRQAIALRTAAGSPMAVFLRALGGQSIQVVDARGRVVFSATFGDP